MKKIFHIIDLCFHRRYPPHVYVFYPLYKVFRRRLGLPMPVSNMLVWTTSAILHGGAVGFSGSPVAALVFAGIFLFSGAVSTLVILFGKRRNGTIYLLSMLPGKSRERGARNRR